MDAPPDKNPKRPTGFLRSPVDLFAYKRHALYPFLIAYHPSADGSHSLDTNVTKNAQILARVCNGVFQEAKCGTSQGYLFNAVSCKLSTMYTYWTHNTAHISELQKFILDLCTSRDQYLTSVQSGDSEPYDDDLTKSIDAIKTRLGQVCSSQNQSIAPVERKRPSEDSGYPASKRRRENDQPSESTSNGVPRQLIKLHKLSMLQKDVIAKYQRDINKLEEEVKSYKKRVDLMARSLDLHRELLKGFTSANDNARADKLGDLGKYLWTKVSGAANEEAAQSVPRVFGDSVEEVERFLKEDIRVLVMHTKPEGESDRDVNEDNNANASATSPPNNVNLTHRPAPTSMSP
ncbi:hypothetical protein F4810DRAFT_633382 [Camillea tinctor]|nr:hypothetical protein F4810DRAFT_633382 [Camillea tinctor]